MIQNNTHYQHINEKFPVIANKIQVFWGHPEFVKLIEELSSNDGLRPRAGFPGDVMISLHELAALHDLEFPRLAKKSSGIWNI